MVHPRLNPSSPRGGCLAPREDGGRRRWLLTLAALLAGCSSRMPAPEAEPTASARWPAGWLAAPELLGQLPEPAREFRAAWVATVANIDWPSRPGLSAAAQRQEMQAILDHAAETGLNAIVLQVRTGCDALYASALEPWSEFLTGQQGVSPGYDPLELWVQHAHARGLELHAWFNPFRARHAGARSAAHALHVSRRHPDWVHDYGDLQWLDPGEPEAAEHTLAVVSDVLRRYDVDGIHIDDYFYPYPARRPGAAASEPELPFPDDRAFERAQAAGLRLSRDDWRRRNVDELVRGMHERVRLIRPQARFGVSPFGIGKPALRPPGIKGFSQYDKLYADVERWLAEGWMDYLAPQLYWPRAQSAQSFAVLLDYWRAQNRRGRHVWPGLYTSRINDRPDSWLPQEIEEQIAHVRQVAPGSGHLHFSMVALLRDRRDVASRLRTGLYAQPALVPATPWLASPVQQPLTLEIADLGSALKLRLRSAQTPADLRAWQRQVLWLRRRGAWECNPHASSDMLLPSAGIDALAAAPLDRAGNEGPRTVLRRA